MPLSHLQRAAVFVDGGNFFHRTGAKLRRDVNRLDYQAFGRKLVAPCQCRGVRYYAGQVVNAEDSRAAYAVQRRLLARLKKQNVSVRLGRIEKRRRGDVVAGQLRNWLDSASRAAEPRISSSARGELEAICASAETVWLEKGVDMMCGIDMVRMASDDEYDVAYLVSGDGDFAPAVEMVRGQFKKQVCVCAPERPYHLLQVADNFVLLGEEHFRDCWL